MRQPLDAHEFLNVVRPGLARGDAQALAYAVSQRWTPEQVATLLNAPQVDVRRVSAMVLGLVGDKTVTQPLARALWDEDEQVNEMSEQSLWSIWFRSGSCRAAQAFREGMAMQGAELFERAVLRFQEATRIDPLFAEAYNQCGIAYYFLGKWKHAMNECARAVKLNPIHFGAVGSMGHCYAQLGMLEMALNCYRRALRINPRMPAIARTVQHIEQCLASEKDDSGEFLLDKVSV